MDQTEEQRAAFFNTDGLVGLWIDPIDIVRLARAGVYFKCFGMASDDKILIYVPDLHGVNEILGTTQYKKVPT